MAEAELDLKRLDDWARGILDDVSSEEAQAFVDELRKAREAAEILAGALEAVNKALKESELEVERLETIVTKYVEHVGINEGSYFLAPNRREYADSQLPEPWTDKEWSTLNELAERNWKK